MSETLGKTNSFETKISELYNEFEVKIFKYNNILELIKLKIIIIKHIKNYIKLFI